MSTINYELHLDQKCDNDKVICEVNAVKFKAFPTRFGSLKGKSYMVDISALNIGVKFLKIPTDEPIGEIDLETAAPEVLALMTPDYKGLTIGNIRQYLSVEEAGAFDVLLGKALDNKKAESDLEDEARIVELEEKLAMLRMRKS